MSDSIAVYLAAPAARAAVAALDAFGAIDADNAAALLSMWSRRSELREEDRAAVLAHYAPQPSAYEEPERDVSMPPGGPLAEGIEGFSVRGRKAER